MALRKRATQPHRPGQHSLVTIGAALALTISGTTLTFVGTLGLLALAGIIVNNAVLLLDAIDEFRRAGLPAGE